MTERSHARDAEALAILRSTFQRPRPDGGLPRQFHDKTLACLHGTLQIQPPEDPALRHGLFAAAASHPALVRFSTSFFHDDSLPDGRGMAIKLPHVEGEVCEGAPEGQQDFLLLDQPVQPFRTAAEALELFRTLEGVTLSPARLLVPGYTFPGWNPRRIRWHHLRLLLATGWGHARHKDPSRISYFSGTPFRLGESATKFVCRPDATRLRRRPGRGRDYRERLEAALSEGALGFDFFLQPRAGESDPLDDTARVWTGPLVRVGHLEIPAQPVATALALGDRLAFSPWNCLRAHEPLGSINALRRVAYRASAANRGACPLLPARSADA